MSNAGKNSMRWLETTSTMQAATPAEAANNIPSRRFGSSQEESKIVPLKTTSLAVAKPTTTTMFDPATTAGKNSGSDSVTPLVKRITSSPGMIKTQIAKISYTYPDDRSPPHSTKKYIKPMTTMIQRLHTENPITPTTPRSAQPTQETVKSNIEDYAHKKSERELEIREIQEMLEEITKNPPIFNEVTNELPTSFKETTNETPKFKEITNEYTKIINEHKTSPARTGEKTTPPNSAAGAEEKVNIPTQAEQPTMTTEKSQTSATLNHIFQRSKTDLNLLPTKAATTRWRKSVREPPNEPRSKSTQPPVTKSSELLPGGSPDKKKSYNPQDARRFMEEQRKKRQKTLEFLSSHRSQQQNEKEQIKRRLEELRKYSRKVVSKNLKNAQKRTGATTMTVAGGGASEVAVAVDEASPRKTAKLDTIVFKGAQDRKNRQNKSTTKTTKNAEPKTVAPAENLGLEIVRKSEVQKETQYKDGGKPSALMENQKRVGLLRKPEIKDHSFGAIKEFSFDKENVALDLLTPKLTTTAEQPRIKEKVAPTSTACEMQQPTEAEPPQPQQHQSVSMNNLLLEMPEARLQRTRVVREQATQVRESSSLMLAADTAKASTLTQTPAPNERTELPYWLKPSAVQVYPYNFIMAVRRKLEAIANPPQPSTIKTSYEEVGLKKAADTPLTSMSKDHNAATAQHNVKRRLMVADIAEESHSDDIATHSLDKAAKRSAAKSKQSSQKSQGTPPPPVLLSQTTYSDVTSNFSSISLVLPASNTCSEVSSIKSDLNVTHTKPSKAAKTVQSAEEDNTTVSSSIFNSPEKQQKVGKRVEGGEFKVPRPVSPLSLESIEHLKISSKVKETNIPKRIPLETAEVVEVDFNRLLQDFNRSLSQVIEVNEQLKSTLDKSQLLISPERKHSSKNSTEHQQPIEDEYSTDFEGGSSANAEFEQIATKVIKKNPLPHYKKNLFELTNKVKPLQTSSKSDTGSGATSTSLTKNNLQDLDINLDSVDNSSAEQTTPSKNKLSSLRESSSLTSANSLDKRLQSIEHLKDNLRESILISKANRSEIKTNAERLMHNLTASPKEEKQPLFDTTTAQLSVSKKQKPSHSLSNSTVDSRRVSSRRSLLLHSASERSDIQTALSENDATSAQLSASAQSADAATMLSASPTSSVADKSYTFDSKSNSPKAKTFTITSAKTKTELEEAEEDDETIAEELQNIVTTPQKQNNKNAPKLQQGDHKTSNSSAESSPKTSNESGATKAAYVKAHINRSRGDFMPAADDDNAVSNESHFQAAAVTAAIAANDTRTDSDSAAPPPSYKAMSAATKTVHSPPSHSDKSITSVQQKFASKTTKHARGHELITVFNQSDMELSIISSRNGSISETSLNYSSVGLYEKLIQTETTKSEHLTVLLKMREKALLDRTKGQIAWLELQKERYKAKGLLMQITAIKKKQRGILLKMEKEREEIKRLLQSTNSTTSTTHSSARHHFHHSAGLQQQQQTTSPKRKRAETRSAPPLLLPLPILQKTTRSSSTAQQQQQQQKITTAHSAPIIRANYELESSRTLEELLQKREADLRKRREHVERLMLWHQRLDQEEAEVQQLELMLLNYNNVHAQPLNENHLPQQRQQQQQQTASSDKQQSQEQLTAATKASPHKKQGRDAKMERRLKEIDKSLRELSSISVSNNSATSTDETATSDADYVRTSGNKLNKLWRRLTTQQVERFEATRRYKLCKADLERLYEEAKLAVLRDFAQDEQRVAVELLDKTTATVLPENSLQEYPIHEAAEITNNNIVIPRLNLNFSSGQSDAEDAMVQLTQEEDLTESMAEAVSTQSTLPPTTQGDTYSPCAAEEEFIRQESGSSSSSTSSNCSSHSKHAPQASAESIERHREQLLERNVQKFMELTQRFNGAQPGDGLQRSLSDTQIAENSSGVSKKSSNKAAISQRNIAYYGVKTQKRPSKVVNVEIANSLSSASSILTASSTLRSVQSLKTQTFSAEVNSNCNNYAQHTSDSKPLSANVNNIPLPVSAVATTMSTTTPVASSMIDSLDSCIIEASKATVSAAITTSQATTISATPYATTSPSQVTSAASLTQSETQAQQISEKLEEISAAVSKLTQSNSLLVRSSNNSTNSKPASHQQLQKEQSTKSASTEKNTDGTGHTASTSYSYSYTFEVNEPEITQSHSATDSATIISSNSLQQTQTVPSTSLQTTPPPPNDTSELLSETMLLAKYNADFEDTLDETRLEDISLPQFETTNESNESDGDEEEDEHEHEKQQKHKQSSEMASTKPLDNLAKDTKNSSPQVSASLPPPPMPPPPPPPASSSQLPSTSKEAAITAAAAGAATNNSTNNNSSSQPQLMPDIINELELRRCQQQIQQYEHVTAVPYNMYVREIPNKPPPPYVPPAHGSPMTTIFPSEERIKDLTYRRTHELYCEILKTEYTNEKGEKLPSVLAEKITNIYERIILDICREYLDENHEVLTKSDPSTFHGNLAFFNPPDRLSCLQTFVYKEVRRCLAMDKKQPKRSQVYSVYGQRAKRDHIGKIIIQEMYDEDDKWCNFHHEEAEVLDLIIEEMLTNLVGNIAKEVLLEEGGNVDEVEAAQAEEQELVEQNVTSDETIYEEVSLIESTTSALDAVVIETETDRIEQNSINVETNAPTITT